MSTAPESPGAIDSFIAMTGQARQRFKEIEGVEWRINFSVWGFLAAIAYVQIQLGAPGADRTPIHLNGSVWVVWAVVPAHLSALWLLNQSAFFWRRLGAYYRAHTHRLLDIPPVPGDHIAPLKELRGLRQIPGRYWVWIAIEMTPTVAGAVICLRLLR